MFNETSYSDGLSGAAGKAARKAAEAAAAAAAAQQPAPGAVPGAPASAPAPATPAPSMLSGIGDFLNNLSLPVKIVGIAVLGIVLVKKR